MGKRKTLTSDPKIQDLASVWIQLDQQRLKTRIKEEIINDEEMKKLMRLCEQESKISAERKALESQLEDKYNIRIRVEDPRDNNNGYMRNYEEDEDYYKIEGIWVEIEAATYGYKMPEEVKRELAQILQLKALGEKRASENLAAEFIRKHRMREQIKEWKTLDFRTDNCGSSEDVTVDEDLEEENGEGD